MSKMNMPMTAGIPDSRMASGTAWLPDSTGMRMVEWMRGEWMVMFQGSVFAQYDQQLTKRGDTQWGATDWEMLMAMRPLAGGRLHLHAMTSVEPFVLGGSGYPELLQSGGNYQGAPLHDRQHPHDAIMEVVAKYEHPVGGVDAFVYAGPVGEPALGPVAFMHRPSAENDPFAPIGHHWQDAAHESFGVATAGVSTRRFQLEASAFNAREADEDHLVVDFRGARLDSYTGRLTWMPNPRFVASAWWAYLNEHERIEPDTKMHQFGSALTSVERSPFGGRWSTSFVIGMNVHHHEGAAHEQAHGNPLASTHHPSAAWLVESNLDLGERTAVFVRLERAQKSGDELGFQGGDLTTLYDERSAVLGASTRLGVSRGLEFRLGGRGAVNFVPETLVPTYGTRTPTGFAVYLQLKPVISR